MALMVDRGKFRWDDRVVDLDPEFQLKDPWVTREFRAFDLTPQRSGLPPVVNNMLAMLDFNEAALIGSLRNVEPVSSFRSTFDCRRRLTLPASGLTPLWDRGFETAPSSGEPVANATRVMEENRRTRFEYGVLPATAFAGLPVDIVSTRTIANARQWP
jgi:hypothetical protein